MIDLQPSNYHLQDPKHFGLVRSIQQQKKHVYRLRHFLWKNHFNFTQIKIKFYSAYLNDSSTTEESDGSTSEFCNSAAHVE